MNYKFIARSTTDPNKEHGGVGYLTQEQAEDHCTEMNRLRLEYDTNPIWDRTFWKEQPGAWQVFIKD